MTRIPMGRIRIQSSLRYGFPLASAALAALALAIFYLAAVTLSPAVPVARLMAFLPVSLSSYRRKNWAPGLAYTACFATVFLWQAAWATAARDPHADVTGALVTTFVLLGISSTMRSIAATRDRRESLAETARERGELLERATSLDQVTAFICAEALADCDAHGAGLLVRNPLDDLWEMHSTAGIKAARRTDQGEPLRLAAWLAERDREIIIDDLLSDARFGGEVAFRSLLARPLRNPQGVLMAVLILTHERPGHFLPQDLRSLDALAAAAEIALGHASSYERSGWHNERLAAQLAAIQRTARELNENLAPPSIAAKTLACALEITHAEAGAVLVRFPGIEPITWTANGSLVDGAAARLEELAARRRAEIDTLPAEPLLISDAGGRIVAPIHRDGREFGALVLETGRVGAFRMQDLQAVASLASHAAVTLDNVRLFQEVKTLAQFQRDVLATFSHELRAPLANISALAEVALESEENKIPPEVLELLKTQSRRLAALSQRTLVAERLDAGAWPLEIRPLPLAALAGAAVHRWQRATPGRVILLRGADEAGWAWGDEDATGLVLDNLLENAVKHAAPAAPVTVFVTRGPDRMVTLGVEDCGEPIPAAQREALFERFYRGEMQANRKTYGFGLGLYIVRQLSQAMGGKAWVEPAGEAGNRFAFCLPAMEEGDEDPDRRR